MDCLQNPTEHCAFERHAGPGFPVLMWDSFQRIL